jgi:formate--tetrahydrofolate ligase
LENLGRHIEIIRRLGINPVVVINKFKNDGRKKINEILAYCQKLQIAAAESGAFVSGGKGSLNLAKAVLKNIQLPALKTKPVYRLKDDIRKKVKSINSEIFGGRGVEFSPEVEPKLNRFSQWGYGAKTQYSLSDDKSQPKICRDFILKVTDARLSAGAGFIVIQCGGILTMPGMPDKSKK